MKLTKNQKKLIQTLYTWHGMGGNWASTSQLHTFMNCHRKTTERNLKHLSSEGIVECEKRHYRSNVRQNFWQLTDKWQALSGTEGEQDER